MHSKQDGIITNIMRAEDGIWPAARERGLDELVQASTVDLQAVPGTMRGTFQG